jgi:hypothetical protein
MSNKLDALRAQFNKEPKAAGDSNFKTNNYYPFWQMDTDDRAIVRFLPDANENNPYGFLVEKLQHTLEVNGQKRKIPCLKMFDEDCPVCKLSASYYASDDRDNGKKYYRTKQHVAQALILKDPITHKDGTEYEGEVKLLAIGYQLFQVIKDSMESGELDEVPYDFSEGCNFIIKKTQAGQWGAYNVGSKFERKPSALDEDLVEELTEQLVDLSTILPKKMSYEKVEAMLEASMTGTTYEDDSPKAKPAPVAAVDDEDEEDDTPVATKPAKKKAAPVVETEDDDDDDDEEVQAMLANIRSRRSKASA